jgi:tRNA A58 N-methylase Trm61
MYPLFENRGIIAPSDSPTILNKAGCLEGEAIVRVGVSGGASGFATYSQGILSM